MLRDGTSTTRLAYLADGAHGLTMRVSMITKVTRRCNLRCVYCNDWRADRGPGSMMSNEVLSTLVERALGDAQHSCVDFVWHGGETTMVPLSFYQEAVLLQQRVRRPGQTVSNMIQTNGTRITHAWANFFKTYNFAVGVSLDGPREAHDKHRPFVSGRGSFEAARRGIALLAEHDVPVGTIMVIDDDVVMQGAGDVLASLIELGVNSVSLLSVKPTNQPDVAPGTPTEHYVNPKQMCQFLADLYDLTRAYRGAVPRIHQLESIERHIDGGLSMSCTLLGGCLGRHYSIEPDGRVAHCDVFLGDQDYEVGSVVDMSFAEMRASRQMQARIAENEREIRNIQGCSEFSVCNGWCPHERYTARRHYVGHDPGCCGLRELIEHIRARRSESLAESGQPQI